MISALRASPEYSIARPAITTPVELSGDALETRPLLLNSVGDPQTPLHASEEPYDEETLAGPVPTSGAWAALATRLAADRTPEQLAQTLVRAGDLVPAFETEVDDVLSIPVAQRRPRDHRSGRSRAPAS